MYFNQEVTSWYEGDWENNKINGWGMRRYVLTLKIQSLLTLYKHKKID